ncbi:MAG: MaoC/PaaZ C-terminal domain-containing protein [Alphaproteobacteria bacterium]|jgi:acyl dehydratase
MTATALKVGSELTPVVTQPISRYTLAMFAGGSGDHNPMHIDTDFAHSFGMPDVFAHGMLSMAYLAQVLTRSFDQRAIRSYGVRFVSITPVKATVTCTGKVTEIFEAEGERRARLALTATIDGGVVTLQGDAVVALN